MKPMVVVRGVFGWIVWLVFWVREIAGWILLVVGLLMFYECFVLLLSTPPRITVVVPLSFVGFVVFRGGIHLLKVSAAALICLRAQEQIDNAEPPAAAARKAAVTRVRPSTGPFELGPRQRPI
jgi:hypothetical protein